MFYIETHDMRHILITIFIFVSSAIVASDTNQAADSLLRLLETTYSPEKRILLYRNLADIYFDGSDAKGYLLKMYDEASGINDRKSMLDALNDIIIQEANSCHKDSVLKYAEYIKTISPERAKILLPLYHMRLFNALSLSDKKEEAFKEESNSQLTPTGEQDNLYRRAASAYIMGNGLYQNDLFEKALSYLEKAFKLTESFPEADKQMYQRIIIWRLCLTYAQTGKEKKAVKIMENFIRLVEHDYDTNYRKQRPFYKIDLYRLQYYTFMIGCLPLLTPDQESYYWNRIQKIGKTLTSDLDKYNYYLCANNYYCNSLAHRNYRKAIVANDSLIKFAATLAPQNLPGLYNINSMIYEEIKDYPNALKYLKISHHVQDSLNTEATHRQLNELQVKYDLNALNHEKTMLEIKNKQYLLISMSILLVIVLFISTYFYFSWKKEKRMKMELKVLHAKAQESETMKQSFINSICHEIRTPLNAIVGFSDLIMNEEIDDEIRREFPAVIQRNTALLTGLVNSMLEVASLDVSEEKLPCESVDLRDICTTEMECLRKKENITYKLDIPSGNMYINTNARYLTQVIEHLLNNANKFTEKGDIVLGYEKDEACGKICICVTDTGCGIPQDKHEEVFNRFSKLDTFIPGNGLGLYLCRLIVKRLAGEIKIDPDYAEGTRVVVILPTD